MTTPPFRIPAIFANIPSLIAAESTRHGGVSEGRIGRKIWVSTPTMTRPMWPQTGGSFWPHGTLPEADLAASYQVHGTAIRVATQGERTHGFDALITNQPGLLVGVTVADCTPILVYDPQNKAVAAIHAGWRGTVGGIVTETLRLMQTEFGTDPAQCLAYVGTCIDECHFEVGAEVAGQFATRYQRPANQPGKAFVDLKRANADQLRAAGVPVAQIGVSPYSTVTHNTDYFSHRLEKGITGRMLAVIGFTPKNRYLS